MKKLFLDNKLLISGIFLCLAAINLGLLAKHGTFNMIDNDVIIFLQAHQPHIYIVFNMLISLFEYISYAIIGCTLLFFLIKQDKKFWLLLFASAVCLATISGMKNLFQIARPAGAGINSYFDTVLFIHLQTAYEYGYPSGHVLEYSFLLPVLYFIFKDYISNLKLLRFIKYFFIFLIFAVGMARISLGAHYLSQVVGGYLFGLGLLLIFKSILLQVARNSKSETLNSK